jgi:hypothetical protein
VNGSKAGSLDRSTLVNGVSSDVDDTSEGSGTDGDHDGVTGVDNLLTTGKSLGTCYCRSVFIQAIKFDELHTVHGNTSDNILSQVLGNLQNQFVTVLVGGKGVENGGELLSVEFL